MSVPDDVKRYFEMRQEAEETFRKLKEAGATYFLHILTAVVMATLGGAVLFHSFNYVRRRCVYWYGFALIAIVGIFCTVGTFVLYLLSYDEDEDFSVRQSMVCSAYAALNVCALSTILLVAVTAILACSKTGNELKRSFVISMASVTCLFGLFMFFHDLYIESNRFYTTSDYMAMECLNTHLKIQWITCETRFNSGILLLGFEYLTIYFPHFTMFLLGVHFARTEKNKTDVQKLLSPMTDTEKKEKEMIGEAKICAPCELLKCAAYWIMGFVGIMILVIRPVLIGGSMFAEENYADIFVPLSVLSLFDLVCIEYIICMRQNKAVVQESCISNASDNLLLDDCWNQKDPITVNT